MSQQQWLVLALKIVVIAAFCSLTGWIIVYTRVAAWWRNPIGLTLVSKTAIIALLLIPTAASLFFNLGHASALGVVWADVVLIGLITPIMIWRSVVWVKVSRRGMTGTLPCGEQSEGEPQ